MSVYAEVDKAQQSNPLLWATPPAVSALGCLIERKPFLAALWFAAFVVTLICARHFQVVQHKTTFKLTLGIWAAFLLLWALIAFGSGWIVEPSNSPEPPQAKTASGDPAQPPTITGKPAGTEIDVHPITQTTPPVPTPQVVTVPPQPARTPPRRQITGRILKVITWPSGQSTAEIETESGKPMVIAMDRVTEENGNVIDPRTLVGKTVQVELSVDDPNPTAELQSQPVQAEGDAVDVAAANAGQIHEPPQSVTQVAAAEYPSSYSRNLAVSDLPDPAYSSVARQFAQESRSRQQSSWRSPFNQTTPMARSYAGSQTRPANVSSRAASDRSSGQNMSFGVRPQTRTAQATAQSWRERTSPGNVPRSRTPMQQAESSSWSGYAPTQTRRLTRPIGNTTNYPSPSFRDTRYTQRLPRTAMPNVNRPSYPQAGRPLSPYQQWGQPLRPNGQTFDGSARPQPSQRYTPSPQAYNSVPRETYRPTVQSWQPARVQQAPSRASGGSVGRSYHSSRH